MNENIRNAIFKQIKTEPFGKKFGLNLIDLEEGYSRVEMIFTADMENMFGMAHGGALFALIDGAFETASNSHGTMAVALNVSVNYHSSPVQGTKLTAQAKEISKSRKTAAYNIQVTDIENKLIATCQALVYRTEKPLPFLKVEK